MLYKRVYKTDGLQLFGTTVPNSRDQQQRHHHDNHHRHIDPETMLSSTAVANWPRCFNDGSTDDDGLRTTDSESNVSLSFWREEQPGWWCTQYLAGMGYSLTIFQQISLNRSRRPLATVTAMICTTTTTTMISHDDDDNNRRTVPPSTTLSTSALA